MQGAGVRMLLFYFLLAAPVVLLSLRLSACVDELDRKSGLSGAFLGGVMLAAVTSLPELFTSLSAVAFLAEPQMVLGNILGSNLFNCAALSLVALLMLGRVCRAYLSREHRLTLGLTLTVYGLLAAVASGWLDCYWGGLNVASWLILLLYAAGLWGLTGDNDDLRENSVEEGEPMGAMLGEFAALSVLLVIVSVALTVVTERLRQMYGLDASVAGALFLGMATSLPELVSTCALLRLGNFNAAMGNILGSNLFNCAILSAADLLYVSGTIYVFAPRACLLLGLGAVALAGLSVVLAARGVLRACGLVPSVLCYAAFLWLTLR